MEKQETMRLLYIILLTLACILLVVNAIQYTKVSFAFRDFMKNNATVCQLCASLKDLGVLTY